MFQRGQSLTPQEQLQYLRYFLLLSFVICILLAMLVALVLPRWLRGLKPRLRGARRQAEPADPWEESARRVVPPADPEDDTDPR